MITLDNEVPNDADNIDDEHLFLREVIDNDHELLYLDSVMASMFGKEEDGNITGA